MPSPFPGMDPFIESQIWEDFHHAWSLRRPLPPVPIPLAGADPDVTLDLQAMFTTVYDRAGYDYSLNYRQALVPPLSDADQAWAQQLLGHGAL